jgi:two-component system response regulator QseB
MGSNVAILEAQRGKPSRRGIDSTLVLARANLVQLLKWGAPVRVLLQEAEARELCFVRDLLHDFVVSVVISKEDEASLISLDEDSLTFLLSHPDTDLIVIARDTWRDPDTELCRRLHAVRLGTPLLAVSGTCDTGHRAAALRAGADDFMSVPFEVDEFVARAYALVRRASEGSRYARSGPFAVDLARRQIVARGRTIALTLREYDLLSTLIGRAGEVVTRKELEAASAPTTGGTESNAIDVHMSRIREKLGAEARFIETVRGLGYRLRP